MPFTPLHMGPGTAVKAIAGRYFSLTVFGFSQVAIDLEPLIRLLRGDSLLHGYTHTYLGAAAIGIFSVIAGKPICEWLLRAWNFGFRLKLLNWLRITPVIPWFAAVSGALVGTFSHVFLDSIMHSDMHPFAPFAASNNLLYLIPTPWLYWICAVTGVLGLMVIIVLGAWNKWTIEID